MIIKELNGSFGRFSGEKITFSDGINVICGDNESGKSTWCGFIKAMLYGVNTSKRDKSDFLSDKTRYRPWSGAPMEGSMTVLHRGRELTIQRTAQGTAPMKRLTAVYDDTGETIPAISGETMTGVSEEVFSRTAFIGQSAIRVTGSQELEKRMSALVSSGDEEQSLTQLDGRLRAWQRKLKFNKSGKIPALEQENESLLIRLESLNELNRRVVELKSETEQLENRLLYLDRQLELHTLRRIYDAKREAENAAGQAETLKKELTVNGKRLTRDELTALRGEASAAESMSRSTDENKKMRDEARSQAESVRNRLNSLGFSDRTPEEATESAKKAMEYEETVRKQSEDKRPKILRLTLAALSAVSLILGLVMLFGLGKTVPALCFFAVGAALAVGAGFAPRPDPTAATALRAILSEYRVNSASELVKAANDYVNLTREYADASAEEARSDGAYRASAESGEKLTSELISDGKTLFPSITDINDLKTAISQAENRLNDLHRAEADFQSADKLWRTLYSDLGREVDITSVPKPDGDYNDTKRLRDRTAAALTERRSEYSAALGALRTMGDPAVIQGKIDANRAEIVTLGRKYQALTMAIDTLRDADGELRTRFSPMITSIAAEYMARMTGGRYRRLTFDRDFGAMAKTAEDTVSRTSLALSRGTADQLYLSLRLAMCELLLGVDEPCPIILDDALANFDDRRMELALDLLSDIAKKRQVILFSCHTREADYLQNSANIIHF